MLASVEQLVPGLQGGDGAVALSTGQLVAVAVFLAGLITSMAGVIRRLYEARLADRDRMIAERDRRIEQMEERESKRDEKDERYIATLEQAVALLRQQADVTAAALAPPRRTRTGSD